jgi:hypothetical protein
MLPIAGRWIFLCQKLEFHIKDGVCQGVYHKSGALPSHAVVGWRAVGLIGPPRSRQRDSINLGESIIFAKHGEVFYTPPIDEIRRVRKSRTKRRETTDASTPNHNPRLLATPAREHEINIPA